MGAPVPRMERQATGQAGPGRASDKGRRHLEYIKSLKPNKNKASNLLRKWAETGRRVLPPGTDGRLCITSPWENANETHSLGSCIPTGRLPLKLTTPPNAGQNSEKLDRWETAQTLWQKVGQFPGKVNTTQQLNSASPSQRNADSGPDGKCTRTFVVHVFTRDKH